VLWLLRNKLRNRPGILSGLYLFGYGFFRFFIEFFRQPDHQIGLISGLTLGQLFSLILVFMAVAIYLLQRDKKVI
ncbi:MAG TPA: prolipoprotein diacylglyceryl transferase, partial [Candidatus Moranbacteria bacterium]|nr:prolipoprotein diacylglyceryl transferase [Candidatus Moranbacteria bacterium]